MKAIKAAQELFKSGKRIFRITDLQKIFQTSTTAYAYIMAGRLVKDGVIERIYKGHYVMISRRPTDFEIANALYEPSYISLASALNYYGVLIQTPQEFTSVTTRRATTMEGYGKIFSYVHVDGKFFVDYQLVDGFLIATPEKALVDTIFAAALGRASLPIEELNLQAIDREKVRALAAQIRNRAFQKYFMSIKL